MYAMERKEKIPQAPRRVPAEVRQSEGGGNGEVPEGFLNEGEER